MLAGHFAAGLAIRAAEPRLRTGPLMALVFLPDLLWLGLAGAGVELVEPATWFDGWSHSVTSILLQAALARALWSRAGAGLGVAAAGAVLSHLLLDLPMHPAPLQWWPHASTGVGDFLHGWASGVTLLGKTNGWWVEATAVLAGLTGYLLGGRMAGLNAASAWAGAMLVVSLQLAFG